MIALSRAMRQKNSKAQQLNLFKTDLRFHGGSLLHGKRRVARPLSSKDAVHIVLRSSWGYASNSFLLLKNKKDIERILLRISKKYLIKIYRQAIVSNHLHLIIKISSRKNYQNFIRVVSSLIASHIMKMQSFKIFQRSLFAAAKNAGDPPNGSGEIGGIDKLAGGSHWIQYLKAQQETQGKGQAFWQFRPFTRILHWGKDFKTACDYLLKNALEALGFIKYTKRKPSYGRKKKKDKYGSTSRIKKK